jgi:hypothetical protein
LEKLQTFLTDEVDVLRSIYSKQVPWEKVKEMDRRFGFETSRKREVRKGIEILRFIRIQISAGNERRHQESHINNKVFIAYLKIYNILYKNSARI